MTRLRNTWIWSNGCHRSRPRTVWMPIGMVIIALLVPLSHRGGPVAVAQGPADAWRLPPVGPYAAEAIPSLGSESAELLPSGETYRAAPAEAEQELIEVLPTPSAESTPVAEPTPWYYPTQWITSPEWDRGIELGLNGTDGNSESLSVKAGGYLKRKTDANLMSMDLNYAKTVAESRETQHNAIFNTKYEKLFGDSPWTLFTKFFGEYDEFKAFDVRVALNGGLGYKLADDDLTTLTTRFGAGVSHEIGGPDDRYVPEALFGMDYERSLTRRQKMVATIDYFPEWTNFDDFRLVTDFGWTLLVDQEANLSIKLSINNRFDSTPNGRKPNDINYSMLLLWKL